MLRSRKVKIGVISFEHMHGLSYARALSSIEGAELAGIADADEDRGRRMAAVFNTEYYRDYHDLLDTEAEGVIICTNNRQHREVAVAAASCGKHVLVEKPFAVSAADAYEMVKAATVHHIRLMNAFPMRFNQNVLEAKRLIEEGSIGEILCMTGINHGKIPSGWFLDPSLSGGGAIMDHTVHLADVMRWFTGSEYRSVYCESGELIHNKGIEDCGIVNVQFENGVFATIDCSWAHHRNYPIWPQVDVEIVGTKGVLNLKAFGQVERIYDTEAGIIEDAVWSGSGDEGMIAEFAEVCSTGKAPVASGEDGAKALEVALAAYESSRTHRLQTVRHICLA